MLVSAGGSSGSGITINPEEMTAIIKQLTAIFNELEMQALPAIEELAALEFYQEGKAMDAMEAYPDAVGKFTELYDHYTRASTIVGDILETMLETDEAIAMQIIEALEV